MSHAASRAARAVLLLAAFALLALPAGALAKPKHKPKPKCPSSVPAGKGCKKGKGKPKVKTPPTKVSISMLDGSSASVDIPAVPLPGGYVLPGTPTTETIPLTGNLTGSLPVYLLGKDNKMSLTGASIGLGATELLKDAACGGASILNLDPASNVVLDRAKPSDATIFADGRVEANVNVLLKLAFASRQGTGCGDPLVGMGTSETTLPVAVKGSIEKATGLTNLRLASAPISTAVSVCLTPGAPGTPCATPPVAYPVTISVNPLVSVKIGG